MIIYNRMYAQVTCASQAQFYDDRQLCKENSCNAKKWGIIHPPASLFLHLCNSETDRLLLLTALAAAAMPMGQKYKAMQLQNCTHKYIL